MSLSQNNFDDVVYGWTTLKNSGSEPMNVNGSVSAVTFQNGPTVSGEIWFVTELTIALVDAGTADITDFGSLTTLTNGILIRQTINSTDYDLFDAIKENRQIVQAFTSPVFTPSLDTILNTSDGHVSKFIFDNPIKLKASSTDKMKCIVRDNLTGLDLFNMSIKYYRVI